MTKKRAGTASQVGAAPEGTTPGAPPAEAAFAARAAGLGLLIIESGRGNAQRAEEIAQGLGFRVVVVDDDAGARRELEGPSPPTVVLAGLPTGEAVARTLAARGPTRPGLVVAVAGETPAGLAAATTFAADAFALRPYKRDMLTVALWAALGLRDERAKRSGVEGELGAEKQRLLRHGEVDPGSGFYHFEFFKKVLVLELKRARRHGYSLAAALVAVDEPSVAVLGDDARREVHQQVARALRAVVRDIDMPVDYPGGNFLVFLPYTDLAGAERVGQRLEAGVGQIEGVVGQGGVAVRPTVSVGIAALKAGKGVSFARLVRDAGMALRAAQLKGGARVVVKP